MYVVGQMDDNFPTTFDLSRLGNQRGSWRHWNDPQVSLGRRHLAMSSFTGTGCIGAYEGLVSETSIVTECTARVFFGHGSQTCMIQKVCHMGNSETSTFPFKRWEACQAQLLGMSLFLAVAAIDCCWKVLTGKEVCWV